MLTTGMYIYLSFSLNSVCSGYPKTKHTILIEYAMEYVIDARPRQNEFSMSDESLAPKREQIRCM